MRRWTSHLLVLLLGALGGFLARPAFSPHMVAMPRDAEPAVSLAEARQEDTAAIRRVETLPRPPGLLLDSTSADLTGDGVAERLELRAEVDRDPRGRVMWDDGQRWTLVVRRGDAMYPVLDRFVQLGRVRFWAVEQAGAGPSLLVQMETGAGVSLEAFGYAADRDAFVRMGRAGATGNVVHGTAAALP